MAEIKKVSKADPLTAADGAVSLMERLWPALECVGTYSGALGAAVGWIVNELLPIVINASADPKTRDQWLTRLRQAIEEDGGDYPWSVQERWGELCGSRELASYWADQFLSLVRTAWSDPRQVTTCARPVCACRACWQPAGTRICSSC